jgi:WD40 repeat protein
MSNLLRFLTVFLALSAAILACALPIPSAPASQSNGTSTPPFSPEQVGTAVAMTLTGAAPVSVPTAAGVSGLLPHSFYYLGTDGAGLTQVFRLERDGTTQHQITSEPVSVGEYGVSPTDGSVAYVANNQLLWINGDGSDRRLILDAGAIDPNNPFLNNLSSPVFSPDGQTLAYGFKGLQLYSVSTGQSTLVLENQIEDQGGGLFVPRELYSPERYSPDGTKLLITLGYYEGASAAVYYPATNALVRLEGGEGALICCDQTEWSANGLSFYAANPSMGMFSSGLWKVDAATGEVTTLLPGDAGGGSYNGADEAYLAPDNQLYFFFGTFTNPGSRPPLQLVRSAPDGVTGRTVISSEDFTLLNEALWASDASFVIAALASSPEIYQGGQAKIVYLDGRPSQVLTPSAQQMQWGP